MLTEHFPRGVKDQEKANAFPEASWWTPSELAAHEKWRFKPGAILVGQANQSPLGVKDDRHLLTVAGSRAGKGRSVIIPNMCLYPGSVMAIDPKGDLATITAARRGQGSEHSRGMNQDVYVLDPFEVTRGAASSYRSSFNPMDMIDTTSLHGRDDAALLADAMIIPSQSESYWTDAAKMLLTGMILYVAGTFEGDERTLLKVRACLTAAPDDFDEILAEMAVSDIADGVVSRAAHTLVAMSERERASILSTAIVQTDFLDSAAMRTVLRASDFSLQQLKDAPITVYLSLPAGRMGTHSRWLRLMIALSLEAMERNHARLALPVLILMDEFHTLGHMQVIERAAGLIAGFGVRLWPILQDITQLKRHYKESWETFLGNAGLTQWFGINDLSTLEYLSKRLGQTTLNVISQGEISREQAMNGFSGRSVSKQIVDLMTPEELGRYFSRQSGRQLVLWPGTDPIALERINYDQHPLLSGLYDPDPNYL